MSVLVVLAMPYFSIVSSHVHLEWLPGDVHHASHHYLLHVEVTFGQSLSGVLLHDQVVVINIAISSTRSKTHVIFEPVNASNLAHMSLTLIVSGTLSCVEIEHLNCVVPYSGRVEMASIREPHFSRALNLDAFY